MNRILISFTAPLDMVQPYLKSHPRWARVHDSLWIVRTEKDQVTIRDELKQKAPGYKFIVMDVTRSAWATANVSSEVNDWLKS